jgi:hypothetical protein
MDKENLYIYKRVLFSSEDEQNYVIYRKMHGTRDHHINQNKYFVRKTNITFLSYVKSRPKKTKNMNVKGGLVGGATGEDRSKEEGDSGVYMIKLHYMHVRKYGNKPLYRINIHSFLNREIKRI